MMYTDDELVERAKSGDPEAFSELVRRYAESVKGYCYYRTGSFEEAKDLCQEAFVLAYTKLGQLREQAKFGAWIRRIAANACTRWIEKRREFPVEQVRLNEPEQPELTTTLLVRQALSSLPDNERLSLIMHYVDGLSYCEIADFLGISPAAVRGRLYRGRDMLKKEVLEMTKETFENNRLDPEFACRTLQLARTITRIGLGWSPDGRYILCSRYFENGVQLWVTDASGSDAWPISEIGWQEDYGWSPDGQSVVYAYAPRRSNEQPGGVHVYGIASRTSREIASGFEWVQFEDWTGWAKPVWTNDSREFVLLMKRSNDDSPRADSYLFSVEKGLVRSFAPDLYTTGSMHPGDWSPDDRYFALMGRATAESPGRIWVCERTGTDLRPITPESLPIGSDPRYRPSGGLMAFCAFTNPQEPSLLRDLWTSDPWGGDARKVTDSAEMVSYLNPEWTSDGRYIACLSTRYDESGIGWEGIRLVDPDSGEVTIVMENDLQSGVRTIGFRDKTSISPDGQRILFCVAYFDVDRSADGKLAYRNRQDVLYWYDIPCRQLHEIVHACPDKGDPVLYTGGYNWQPLWSPDGNRVLFTRGTVQGPPDARDRMPRAGRIEFADGGSWDLSQPHAEPNLCVYEIGG